MKKVQVGKGPSYTFVSLKFPGRPVVLPTHTQLAHKIVALVAGGTSQEQAIHCETLEEIQILWDLAQSGALQHLTWGVLSEVG